MTPEHKTPPAGSGPPDTSGLNTMADALNQISPLDPSPLPLPKVTLADFLSALFTDH